RRRVHKVVPPPPQLPEGLIGVCLAALAPFAASLTGDSAPEATAREAASLFRAPLRLWGGPAQLADLLRKKATESGGDVIADGAEQLRLDRKAITFVLGGSEVTASCVVLACGARGEAESERRLTVAGVSDAGFSDEQGLLNSVRAALAPVLPFFDRHIVHQSADLNPPLSHPILRPHDDAEPIGLRPISEAHD